jgi:hypothetical protein
MKSGGRWLIRTISFIVLRVLPVSSFVVLALGNSFSHADPLVQPATATIGVYAGVPYFQNNEKQIGPAPYSLISSVAWDYSGSGNNSLGPYTFIYSASSTMSVSFTSSLPVVDQHALVPDLAGVNVFGTVTGDVIASPTISGPGAPAELPGMGVEAGASGTLLSYFTVVETKLPPLIPENIPLTFGASGSGEDSEGTGYFDAFAVVLGVPGAAFYMSNATHITTVPYTYILPPSAYNFSAPIGSTYEVEVYANTYCIGYFTAPAAAEVTIDPIIGFNQAAFDAMYGTSAYNLSYYFSIVPSPNLPPPVPEPATLLLLSSGLIGLGVYGRKKFLKK